MKDAYLDILKDWERTRALPAVYESLDVLFPEFGFRRVQAGGPKDRWVSRLKADLSEPKHPNPEKTVVGRSDMRFREQGEWSEGEKVMERIMRERGFSSIYEAFSYVAQVLCLDMPRPDSGEVKRAVQTQTRREKLLSYLEDYFCWCLCNARHEKAVRVREYLEKKRGFPRESWEALGFGFVPDWGSVAKRVTSDGGFTLEELDEACGVGRESGRALVGSMNVLSIPFRSAGVLRGFLFRSVSPDARGPKYIATSGLDRKAALFNLPGGGGNEVIGIVEGELDALQATARGIPGICAIGGSDLAGDRKSLARDALGRGVKKIILCLDLDPKKGEEDAPDHAARHRHVMRSVQAVKEIDFSFDEIYVALLPYACDPDEFMRGEGTEAFLDILRDALPYWEYDYLFRKGELPKKRPAED